eukprot:TRINITY_DN4985_c0_g1_i4.p1 TRINITY_DN4985_c0_g1~~TRINITY_DN4985_c0_g1_i4.p1  ORF type:complete len:1065 (-),score=265.52 TRINITY_DN4985_c0_g1_i4:192-2954(-)
MALPIMFHDEVIGALYLEHSVSGSFTAERLAVGELLCSQLAISVENSRLYQASQANERKYKLLFDTLNQAIWITDENRVTLWMNDQWHSVFGSESVDLDLHAFASRHVHPEDLPIFEQLWVLPASRMHTEMRLRTTRGEYRWFLVDNQPVTYTKDDSGGEMTIGYYSSAMDIHDRKIALQQAEERKLIEASAQWHRTLANSIPDIVWIAQHHTMSYFNAKWTELTGQRSDPPSTDTLASSMWWTDALHPDEQQNNEWQRCLNDNTKDSFEIKVRLFRASDQTYRWHLIRGVCLDTQVHLTGSPVSSAASSSSSSSCPSPRKRHQQHHASHGGSPLLRQWFGSAVDIDGQIMAEEALKAARRVAEIAVANQELFLANMSHEIRTPLNGLMGMGHLVLNTALDANQRDCIDTMQRSADALLRIINDILDFSKIRAGEVVLQQEVFCVERVMDEVCELLVTLAQAKGVALHALAHKGVPSRVVGDHSRLRQVLVNLIGNAIKFTESGEVFLECRPISGEETQRLEDEWKRKYKAMYTPSRDSASPSTLSPHLTPQYHQQLQLPSMTSPPPVSLATVAAADEFVRRSSSFRNMASTPIVMLTSSEHLSFKPSARALVASQLSTSSLVLKEHMESIGLQSVFSFVGTIEQVCEVVRIQPDLYNILVVDSYTPEQIARLAAQVASLRNTVTPIAEDRPEIVAACYIAQRVQFNVMIMPPDVTVQYVIKPVTRWKLANTLSQSAHVYSAPLPALPLLEQPPPPPLKLKPLTTATTDTHEGHPPHNEQRRLLIVEDNLINQKVLAKYMQSNMGHVEVTIAKNGQEAVDHVTSHAIGYYSLVLMDLFMPVLDGFEATEYIRAWEAKQHKQRGKDDMADETSDDSTTTTTTMTMTMTTETSEPKHPHTMIVALTANVLPEVVAKCAGKTT